jgi:hypothetical protein
VAFILGDASISASAFIAVIICSRFTSGSPAPARAGCLARRVMLVALLLHGDGRPKQCALACDRTRFDGECT